MFITPSLFPLNSLMNVSNECLLVILLFINYNYKTRIKMEKNKSLRILIRNLEFANDLKINKLNLSTGFSINMNSI